MGIGLGKWIVFAIGIGSRIGMRIGIKIGNIIRVVVVMIMVSERIRRIRTGFEMESELKLEVE